MLTRLTPIEFNRPLGGKSQPSFITCERPDGSSVEVVAKFSASCERGVTSLAMEVIAGCLAGDLGLPVPEPFLVEATPDWIDVIPDPGRRAKAQESSSVAFGSHVMTGQFTLWNAGTRL